jgi:hypothetical protein
MSARGSRSRLDVVVTAGLVVTAILLVGAVRERLFEAHRRVKEGRDVYFLPPPEQVRLLSLGHRSAMADVLWSHVMVSQGLHTFEKRRFENLVLLYDAIYALDPDFRTPYLYADALITFQGNTTPFDEVVKVREILERGVKERPYDAEIWLALGQFVAYVAPSTHLDQRPEVAAAWRREGAHYLARAAELGAADSNISWQALGGANILAKEGELVASLRFLERTYAVTDDEELRRDIEKKMKVTLAKLQDEQAAREVERNAARQRVLDAQHKASLPFVTKTEWLALGPPPFVARCAGGSDELDCATDWVEWERRHDAAIP